MISTRSATRIDGHFADPSDGEREARLEERLNQEFEDPVHKFIDQLRYRTFVFSRSHIRQLTRYVTLLFNRSQARRKAAKEHVDIVVQSMNALLANEEQLSQIAANWTLDMIRRGYPVDTTVTLNDVRDSLNKHILDLVSIHHEQTSYVDTMERSMGFLDEGMDNGSWNVIHTTFDNPFVIGDAPVVTWERNDNNFVVHGQGFARPNVEVFLPIASTACLHILPIVQRTRPLKAPSVREVNEAEAAFSTHHCFANINSRSLDSVLQPQFGRSQIGTNVFSIRHRNYKDTMFELLMSGGKNFNAPNF